MSTIKVDSIATRTGSGNITVSNTIAGTSATLSGTLGVTGATTVGGDLTVDTSTLKVDSSNNRVGVGLTAPEQPLHVRSSTFAYVRSESTNSTLTGFDMGQHQDGSGHLNLRDNHPIKISTNDALRLRVDADGLKFGSDTAAANALDDYEEGTWTPTFVSTSASFSYSVQGGNYTKVGRLVFANFRIQLSGSPSGTTSNVVFVGGLPFVIGTQVGTYHGGHPGHYFNFNLSQTGTLAYQLPQGESKVELKVVGDNLGETAVLASHLNSTAQIRGQILYHTA